MDRGSDVDRGAANQQSNHPTISIVPGVAAIRQEPSGLSGDDQRAAARRYAVGTPHHLRTCPATALRRNHLVHRLDVQRQSDLPLEPVRESTRRSPHIAAQGIAMETSLPFHAATSLVGEGADAWDEASALRALESQTLRSQQAGGSLTEQHLRGVSGVPFESRTRTDSEASTRQLHVDVMPTEAVKLPRVEGTAADTLAVLQEHRSFSVVSGTNISVRRRQGLVPLPIGTSSDTVNGTSETDALRTEHSRTKHTWFSSFSAWDHVQSPGDPILDSAVMHPLQTSWDKPRIETIDALEQFVTPDDDSVTETLELFGAGVPVASKLVEVAMT